MQIFKISAPFLLGFFLSITPVSFAQNLPQVANWEVEESLVRLSPIRFLPDHPLYFVIAIKEKVDHFTKPNKAKKALFDVILSGKKIKEVYLLSQKNNFAKAVNSLENYQTVNQKLREELVDATNQGLPVFEIEQVLADNLTRHLKIIVVLATKSTDANFRKELAKSLESIKLTARLLEKHLPDATFQILDFANKIRIT